MHVCTFFFFFRGVCMMLYNKKGGIKKESDACRTRGVSPVRSPNQDTTVACTRGTRVRMNSTSSPKARYYKTVDAAPTHPRV